MFRVFIIQSIIFCIIFSSCSNRQLINHSDLDSELDSVLINYSPCYKWSTTDLAFRSSSSASDVNQKVAKQEAIDIAKDNIYFSISSFLDGVVFSYLEDDSLEHLYLNNIDIIVNNRVDKYRIVCEKLSRDTIYTYSVSIEIAHVDLLFDLNSRLSQIDPSYDESYFTELYYYGPR